jgi:hypothetical protein
VIAYNGPGAVACGRALIGDVFANSDVMQSDLLDDKNGK